MLLNIKLYYIIILFNRYSHPTGPQQRQGNAKYFPDRGQPRTPTSQQQNFPTQQQWMQASHNSQRYPAEGYNPPKPPPHSQQYDSQSRIPTSEAIRGYPEANDHFRYQPERNFQDPSRPAKPGYYPTDMTDFHRHYGEQNKARSPSQGSSAPTTPTSKEFTVQYPSSYPAHSSENIPRHIMGQGSQAHPGDVPQRSAKQNSASPQSMYSNQRPYAQQHDQQGKQVKESSMHSEYPQRTTDSVEDTLSGSQYQRAVPTEQQMAAHPQMIQQQNVDPGRMQKPTQLQIPGQVSSAVYTLLPDRSYTGIKLNCF